MIYEVILDIGETPNKCTIAPLAPREDFKLFYVKQAQFGPLKAPLLLHHEGEDILRLREVLGPLGQVTGIATIDCVWRRLDLLLSRAAEAADPRGTLPRLARIPEGFVTAYPRKSTHDFDPEGGLATIEAIFVAAALFGNWDVSLLSEYYFGRKFVELNAARFMELGVREAGLPEALPVRHTRPRDALQRKRNRGRAV